MKSESELAIEVWDTMDFNGSMRASVLEFAHRYLAAVRAQQEPAGWIADDEYGVQLCAENSEESTRNWSPLYRTSPTEAPNFCPRCGKRMHCEADYIHTCSSPKGETT